MPTSSPRALISAPPELPGLMAASVWMKSSYERAPFEAAAGRADDAERDGLIESERIADREHPLGDLELRRISPRQHRQVLRVDLQHRDVGRFVDADDLRLQLALVAAA